jgi:alpha-mannosidase
MKPTYHIVSHSHWDREWYKSFSEFRAMLVNMVDDLLELLNRDPAFRCFTLDGQTIILDDYLAVRPERERTLRDHVRAGRIIVGPWYVLPDEFLVSAEATVRNLQIGLDRSREFGGQMEVGYIPDSFGHIAMMPAILQGFGITSALIYRGFGGEEGQNRSEYTWRSPDGSAVLLTHLFRHGYSAGYFHQDSDQEILARVRELQQELDARATTSHRLMMNGGDHHWPDPRLPETIRLLQEHLEGEFIHSSLPRYIEAVRAAQPALSEIRGEQRFGYRYAFVVLGGVYSSRMYLKQANWQQQNRLQRYVEPVNALAVAYGARSQTPSIRHAWKTLLQNHPHDSICGCSIDAVHREMMTRFAAVQDTCSVVLEEALARIVPYDDRAFGDDSHLFFVNPSPISRSDVAPAEVKFYLQDIIVGLNPDVKVKPRRAPVRGFVLRNATGAEVPFQITAHREGYDITYTKYNYPKQTYAETYSLLVDARNVPPLGFEGYRIVRTDRMPRYRSGVKVGPRSIENDRVKVEVTAGGGISIRDAATGTVYRGLHILEDGGDVGDEYNYSYPRQDRLVRSGRKGVSVRVVERGPLRGTLEVRYTLRVPAKASEDRRRRSGALVSLRVITRVSVSQGDRSVTFTTTVDNTAQDHRLRVLFPTAIPTTTALADSQFTVVRRTSRTYRVKDYTIEHPALVAPMQRFVAVHDRTRAFLLMSDGLPEYELSADRKGTLALTLLRCVGLLAGEDLITRPGGKAGWHNETPEAQCPGTHVFRYAVLPLTTQELDLMAHVNAACEKFHLPLLAVRRKNTSELPLRRTFAGLTSAALTFSAMKEADQGNGLIIRVYNPTGISVKDTLRFAGRVRGAWKATLNEEPREALPVEEEHALPLEVPPWGIMTVRVELEPNSAASSRSEP